MRIRPSRRVGLAEWPPGAPSALLGPQSTSISRACYADPRVRLPCYPGPSNHCSTTREMKITQGNVPVAVDIMREAASWLIEVGKPMWRLEDITQDTILTGITKDDVYVGWVGDESATAMVLQWSDPFFWPQAKDDSGFIHKLSVRRRFAGTNVSSQMVEWAKQETRRRGKAYLRLDCAGDRARLCFFYEGLGFRRTDRRMVGVFDSAFYELRLK